MEARFLAKVNKIEGGCWEWTGDTFDEEVNGKKYGKFTIGGCNFGAHRIAYELWTGEIPPELVVRHQCDNPPCVNPAHLLTGTQKENMADKIERNRQYFKLTKDDVVEIKVLLGFGVSGRQIAQQFGVTPSTVYSIDKGKTWAHVIPASRTLIREFQNHHAPSDHGNCGIVVEM